MCFHGFIMIQNGSSRRCCAVIIAAIWVCRLFLVLLPQKPQQALDLIRWGAGRSMMNWSSKGLRLWLRALPILLFLHGAQFFHETTVQKCASLSTWAEKSCKMANVCNSNICCGHVLRNPTKWPLFIESTFLKDATPTVIINPPILLWSKGLGLLDLLPFRSEACLWVPQWLRRKTNSKRSLQ